MVAVQLMDGRPQVLVEGEAGAVKLEVSTALHDGDWHVIHLQLDSRVSRGLLARSHSNKNDAH